LSFDITFLAMALSLALCAKLDSLLKRVMIERKIGRRDESTERRTRKKKMRPFSFIFKPRNSRNEVGVY
jgi:hypothetical protein